MPDEIYVSTDVEADGPIPGPNSLLSLGSVALRADKTVLGEFSVNLLPLRRCPGVRVAAPQFEKETLQKPWASQSPRCDPRHRAFLSHIEAPSSTPADPTDLEARVRWEVV